VIYIQPAETKMKLIISLLVLLFVVAPVILAAEDVRPDGWAGMVLNVSSPEDAVRLFGPPRKDKDKIALDLPRTLSWLSDKWKQKIFRTITYKKLREYAEVRFSFLDGKLVAISMEAPNGELDDNWIDPDDLEKLFGVPFKPQQRTTKKLVPLAEFLASAPDKSVIVAISDNYIYISGLFESRDAKRRKKINARGARYPGFVSDIEIISRTLAAT
jgi:hypothetical protein